MNEIRDFTGQYAFLSRDYDAPIRMGGTNFPQPLTFPTVTHALVAARTTDFAARSRIANLPTPDDAKRAALSLDLRSDYDDIKLATARTLVQVTSRQHPEWAAQLISTGDAELVYENDINDRYWGRDRATGRGLNNWGKLLMEERARLRASQAPQLEVVA